MLKSATPVKKMSRHSSAQKGQGLVEYALILVLVAIVSIVILALLGPAVGNVFSNVIANLGGVPQVAANVSGGGSQAQPTSAPAATATTGPTPTPVIVTGWPARTQYCVDRSGWVGGVNWGGAIHTFVDNGVTYQVTGAWNCNNGVAS